MTNTRKSNVKIPTPMYASSEFNSVKGVYTPPGKETIRVLIGLLFDDDSIFKNPGYKKLEEYCENKISRNNSVVLYSINEEFMKLCHEIGLDTSLFERREVVYSGEHSTIRFSEDFKNEPVEVKTSKLDELMERFS